LIRLATSYRLPGNLSAWRVGAAVRAQNRIFRTNVPIRQSGYAIVDLNAGWQATTRLDVSMSVTNLFDRSYYQSISALDSGNAFGDPLSYNMTARYRF
jgi:outer-membrane receptor for ferric coprogen and ferric-rhodotorulic acid